MDFPFNGIDKGRAASNQANGTSPHMKNVRPYDVQEDKARGGQRPGLDKAYNQRIGGQNAPIVEIVSVTVVV